MADQKKWFKVWTTLLIDSLSTKVDDIGRFTILGCLIASRGDNGKLVTDKTTLLTLLQCKDIPASFIKNFNIIIEEIEGNSNGNLSVTFKNWNKYQIDSTGYDRQKRFRETHSVTAKVTGKVTAQDKIRIDKKREDKKHIYGSYKNVLLKEEELKKLKDQFGEEGSQKWIETLSEGIEMKGYKYDSHYLAILKWVKRENKQEGKWNVNDW